jgi:PDZ domain-containing protein
VRRTSTRSRVVVAVVLFVVVGIGVSVTPVPYYTLGPGMVRPTADLIDVGGAERRVADGSVAFVTVSVFGRATIAQVLLAWARPSVDLVHEDEFLGGQTPEQNKQFNEELMQGSKSLAEQVALELLGYAEPVGARVVAVVDGAPAAAVLAVGDVVVALQGVPVRDSVALVRAIRALDAGSAVSLEVRPVGGTGTEVRTLVPDRNPDTGATWVGANVATEFEDTFPYDLEIDSAGVGGPSAGLAFTLGLVDLLTEGDLTGGSVVAATGVIRPDGTVGPIGGVAQKAAAARRAGVDIFLVPAELEPADIERARSLAGTGTDVVAVANLREAIRVLVDRGGAPADLADAA